MSLPAASEPDDQDPRPEIPWWAHGGPSGPADPGAVPEDEPYWYGLDPEVLWPGERDERAAAEPGGPARWTGRGETMAAGFLRGAGGPRGAGFADGGVADLLEPGPVLAELLARAADEAPAGRDALDVARLADGLALDRLSLDDLAFDDAAFDDAAFDDAAFDDAALAAGPGDPPAPPGLAGLTDSELVGVLCGWRRMASWAAAGEAAAVIALARRRAAESAEPRKQHLIEHVDDEIAAALTLTGMSARRLLEIAGNLARLDATRAALAAGVIDWARAVVIADELAALSDDDARAAEAMVLPGAGRMTTGQLRSALRRAVISIDPDAVRRRREAARRESRVELWTEPSGNCALAGRELDPAVGITGDRWLTAQARWLRSHGAEGTLQQLRLAVFGAVVNGQSVDALLAPAPPPDETAARPDGTAAEAGGEASSGSKSSRMDGPGSSRVDDPGRASRNPEAGAPSRGGPPDRGSVTGSVTLIMPWSAWTGRSDAPGEVPGYGAADASTCRDLAATLAAHPATRWCVTFTDPGGRAVAHACAGRRPPPSSPGPPGAGPPGTRPAGTRPPGTGPPGTRPPGTGPPGTGPPGTGPPGTGLAGSGPPNAGPPDNRPPDAGPPPASPPGPEPPVIVKHGSPGDDLTAWLAALRPERLEAGTCTHQRQVPGYHPPAALANLIRVRQPACTYPGCRRPARQCDLDHVTPWDQGGRTCECNVHPLCRRHHRAKQCPGWHAAQPEPGTVTWTTPSGRTYATRPTPYPL